MSKLRSTVAMLAAMALATSLAAVTVAADETEPEPVGVFSIEGMTWLLTGQVIDGQMMPMPSGAQVSLRMEDGRAGGNGGCNSYFTSYVLDGFDLTFDEIGSTLMACPGPVSAIESAYFANLGQVASYQSGGIQMALLDGEGEFLLEFDLAPETSVVGSWVATGVNNQLGENAGVVTSAITSEITAEYSADGDLTGFDGCNDYFTTYELDGDSITIDPLIGQTMMACPSDEHTQQSQWYLGALTSATTWAVGAAGNLELRDADGSLQVSYSPAQ